jgi:hypothetical protein
MRPPFQARQTTRSARRMFAGSLLVLSIRGASAQVTFSIDFQSPTNGAFDSFAALNIFEFDILSAPLPGPPIGIPGLGPLPPPGNVLPGRLGILPGPFGFTELDALSHGTEPILMPGPIPPGSIHFSVDEFAVGGFAVGIPPTVFTEGAFGAAEASADVFINAFPIPAAPPLPLVPPPGVPAGNTAEFDGNGLPSASGFVYPGLGLIEPNPPTFFIPFDFGDNLDALDVDTTPAELLGPIYFSLDSAFIDPLEGPPANTGTAAANFDAVTGIPFAGGDVIFEPFPAGPMTLYAPALSLGLDRLGKDTDDLDALALSENGIPGYQPSMFPYDWVGGATDMLLFSVRRGSAVVGAIDGFYGMPIVPGDILTTPLGGVGPPTIFIPAEWLGLQTLRFADPNDNDDLDALDITVPMIDCNGNGVADDVDIATGFSVDCDNDGVPDECVCVGDLNGDRVVSIPDLARLLSNFGIPFGASWTDGDLDCDGDVDLGDLTIFLSRFGASCP